MDDITKIDIETEVEPSDMELWKSQIQTTEEAIQCLKQGLGSFDRVVVEDCMRHWYI